MSGAGRSPLLIANLGAEEQARGDPPPAAAEAASLWRLLFGRDARQRPWPADLGEEPEGAAFPWLEGAGAFAWLVTEEARSAAARAGRELAGPEPALVRRVHDKAFAQEAARGAGFVPPCLREAVGVLSPEELADPGAAVRSLEERLAAWPAWLREHGKTRATLKPRLGSSGRGRVAFESAGDPALPGAFARLRCQGGAILEPWLERRSDLSVQLHVDADGLLLLGTLEQHVSAAGVPRGLSGTLDRRGRVTSGTRWDEALREAAVAVAGAARETGFRGPCGVDAFVFSGPGGEPELRPVVELNARFTLGTVAVGLARRALPLVRAEFDLDANERLRFHLALEAPPGGWPEAGGASGVRWIGLGAGPPEAGPALLLARELQPLAAWLSEAKTIA